MDIIYTRISMNSNTLRGYGNTACHARHLFHDHYIHVITYYFHFTSVEEYVLGPASVVEVAVMYTIMYTSIIMISVTNDSDGWKFHD